MLPSNNAAPIDTNPLNGLYQLFDSLTNFTQITIDEAMAQNTSDAEEDSDSSESLSPAASSESIVSQQNTLTIEQQRTLSRLLLLSLGWEKKYPHMTVRQAIIKELILKFKADDKKETPDFYLLWICKILNPKIKNEMPDLKTITDGAKIVNLLSLASELDVCIGEICGSNQEKLQPNIDVSIELIAECEILYASLLQKHLSQIKHTSYQLDKSNKNDINDKVANLFLTKLDAETPKGVRKLHFYSISIQSKCHEIQKVLINYLDNTHEGSDFKAIKLDIMVQKLSRISAALKSRLKALHEAIKFLNQNFTTNSMIFNFCSSIGNIATSEKKDKKDLKVLNAMQNFGTQFQSQGIHFNDLSIALNAFENNLPKFLHCAQGHLQRMKLLSPGDSSEKKNSYNWIASIDILDVVQKKPKSSPKEMHPAPSKKDKKKVSKKDQNKIDSKIPEKVQSTVVTAKDSSGNSKEKPPVTEDATELSQLSDTFRKQVSLHLKTHHPFRNLPKTDLKDNIHSCLSESRHHMVHASNGLEILIQAMQQSNWQMLGEIVPMIVMDWGIQLEQIMTMTYVCKYKETPYYHHLVKRAASIGIDRDLTPETLRHFAQMNMSIIWGRYPVNSAKYHRQQKLELPPPLQLILQSYRFMEQAQEHDFNPNANAINLLKDLFALHRQQIKSIGEVAAVVSGKPLTAETLAAQELLLNKFAKTESQLLKSLQSTKSKEDNQPSKIQDQRIAELKNMINSIDQCLHKNANYKGKDNPFAALKEAKGHLQRLCVSLELSEGNKNPRYAAWIFRNFLKVQHAFEQLYLCRCLAEGYGQIVTHDLDVYHETLDDPDEMKASLFTYGKSMHYSVLESQEKGNWPVDYLKQLEKSIKRFIGVDSGFIKANERGKGTNSSVDIQEKIDNILAYAVPLLKAHVNKCLHSISSMN